MARISGYSNLHVANPFFFTGERSQIAGFRLAGDPTELFPYINAVVRDAILYENPVYIRFTLEDRLCSLYPEWGAARFFEDRNEAERFLERLVGFLNDLDARKDRIVPNHRKYATLPVLDLFKLLPGTNCKQCGFLTCMAFAAAVAKGEASPRRCPDMAPPIRQYAEYPVYDRSGRVVSTMTIDIFPDDLPVETPRPRRPKKPSLRIESEKDGIRVRLTGRQVEVLRLVAEGFSNTEISEILTISPHTVKSHVIQIFNKLGVNDRTQAAVWAARKNLI